MSKKLSLFCNFLISKFLETCSAFIRFTDVKNSRSEKKTYYIPAWTPPRRVTLYVIGLSEHVASVLIPRLYPETMNCFSKGDIRLNCI